MKWNPEIHATGVEEIDKQHAFLFDFSESYRENLDNGAGLKTYEGALELLMFYAETHFGFEENCVHAAECPFARQNNTEHKAFVKMLKKEKLTFDEDGFDFERSVKLLDQLNAWLDSHIRRVALNLKLKYSGVDS